MNISSQKAQLRLSAKFNIQNSTMSPVLPFDIISLIIDNVGENNDTNLLKELALVSHSFLHICSKHLFSTVVLHDADPMHHVASSKKGFVKLLESKPDVVKYIRELTYIIDYDHVQSPHFSPHLNLDNDDNLLSPILPNFLRTIPRLNCLKIKASLLDWSILNSSITSALLHLMHLPTINHIDLSYIHKSPLSSLTPSVNLLRLDIHMLSDFDLEIEEDGSPSPKSIVKWESMPKIRDFRTFDSYGATKRLLHAKMQDGRPAFNFMDLRQFTTRTDGRLEDEQNIRYVLQNAKSLEKFHLYNGHQSLVGLHDILSLSARTLKVFDLSVLLYNNSLTLTELWVELEAMAGRNTLEAFSFEVQVDDNVIEDFVGSIFRQVEGVLVKPGWSSALREVSFKVEIRPAECSAKLLEALQSLPDKHLSHLPKHESVAFNFSAYIY